MLEGTVEQIIDSTPMLGAAATQDTVRLIRHGVKKLIDAVMAVDQDGVPRLCRGARQGRIISTVDPEMRHGRKSSQQRSDGYKLSAAATNSIEPLIIAVNVCPASETDGPQAEHLIDGQPPEQQPERILGDTAYGNGPVCAELAERLERSKALTAVHRSGEASDKDWARHPAAA
jgi:hypothetical protein